MSPYFEEDRRDALLRLLAKPDPLELRGLRGYRYTCSRDPRRSADKIKRDLGTTYVEHRRQEARDVSSVVSVRRLRLRLLA